MDTGSLKLYIYEKNKIEFVLEKIGCHCIKYHENKCFYSCANYNGDNKGAINVKNNPYINVVNWTRKKEFDENSDIITLVEYNKRISFIDAIKYLHHILGLSFSFHKKQKKEQKKPDILNVGADILLRHKSYNKTINATSVNVLGEDVLEDYISILYIGWFREGVMPWSAKKFGLAYSYKRNRVIIPMRYWMDGQLLGVNTRSTIENCDEFGIKKYWITPSYPKSLNLFGLWENRDAIQKAGYVVVVEAEKSVLKRDSLCDSTLVALSGHFLSDEQARILIGLNVEIIFAFDKDVPIEEIWYACEKVFRSRKTSYLYDSYDILGSKDSPADARNKDYEFLFENRVIYSLVEHELYIKSLERE